MNYTRAKIQRLLAQHGSHVQCRNTPFVIGYWAAYVGEPEPDAAEQRRGWRTCTTEMARDAAGWDGGAT